MVWLLGYAAMTGVLLAVFLVVVALQAGTGRLRAVRRATTQARSGARSAPRREAPVGASAEQAA